MLVILKKPLNVRHYEFLAIDIQSFNMIAISKTENTFKLVIHKYFDGHLSNHSDLTVVLDNFDTYKECLSSFQELVDALHSGESVLDLREESSPKEEKGEKRKSRFL